MQEAIIIISLALFGIVNCFFGYCAFKVLLPIWGVGVGAIIGAGLTGEFISPSPLAAAVAGIIGAVLGALLFSRLYFVGIFMIGGIFAGTVAHAALPADRQVLHLLFTAAIGAGGGIAALLAQKIIIILATANTGAAALVSSLFYLLGYRPVTEYFIDREVLGEMFLPAVGAVFALTLAGIIGQLFYTAPTRKKTAVKE